MDSRKRPLANPKSLKLLGEKIRQLRLEKDMSQEQLAHQARIERSYMGAIERGERNPSFDKVLSIARALGIPTSELMK